MNISRADLSQRLLPILLAHAVVLMCGIIGVRLASHWVTPEDYGNYGIFVSLAPLGPAVVFAGLLKLVGRRWPEATDRSAILLEIVHAGWRKVPWLIGAAAVATLFAAPVDHLRFGMLLLTSAVLLAIGQLAQTVLQAERAHWSDFGVTCAASITRSFIPLLLYVSFSSSLITLLSGFCIHAAALTIVAAIVLRGYWLPPATTNNPSALAREYDGPLFIGLAIAGWIVAGFNRWIVAWFFGAEQAGYFTLATNIAIILPMLLSSVLLQYFQPGWFMTQETSSAAHHALARQVDRVALVYAATAIVMTVALHFAMPLLVGPIVSERYSVAGRFVLGSGCFMTAIGIGYFYHTLLLAVGCERQCGPVDLSGAAFLIVGSLVSAAITQEAFILWLVVSPVVTLVVNRTLARRVVLGSS